MVRQAHQGRWVRWDRSGRWVPSFGRLRTGRFGRLRAGSSGTPGCGSTRPSKTPARLTMNGGYEYVGSGWWEVGVTLVRWDCWVLLGPGGDAGMWFDRLTMNGRGWGTEGGGGDGGLGMCSVLGAMCSVFGGARPPSRPPLAGSEQTLQGRRDDGGSGREAGVSAPWHVSTLSGQCVQILARCVNFSAKCVQFSA